jgi:septal ring factor EnvC (AmiA/AmiB activator)
MFRRALFTPIAALFLLVPTISFAQVDSFFDIFTEIDAHASICDVCDSMKADIDAKQLVIDSINADITTAERDLTLIGIDVDIYERGIEQAEKSLEALRNPKDYVESEGRHYDSADNAAMQRRSANLWDTYKSGDISAEQYSEEIEKEFDDPGVAEELEKIKKSLDKEISDSIKEMNKMKKEAEQDRKDVNARAAALTQELSEHLTELEKMIEIHAQCLLQCKEGQVNVDDLGVEPKKRTAVDSFFDIFTELVTGPPPILPDPVLQFPIEIVELDLKSVEPIVMLPDSFFDIFTGLSNLEPLPVPEPKCQMCDPIAKEISDKEAELEGRKSMLDMAADLIKPYREMEKNGKTMLEEAQKSLESLRNPTDYAESDGKRYDNADHSAMQVRNQRLWAAYKAGILSAADVEAEWAKPIDDPDVQADLEDIKADLEEELEDVIEDIEEQLKDLEETTKEFNKELEKLKKDITDCEAQLAAMRTKLAECEKRCKTLEDATSFVEELIAQDPQIWETPSGGFVIPVPKDDTVEDDVEGKLETKDDENSVEDDLVVEVSPTSTVGFDNTETSFLCGLISFFCDDEEVDEDASTGGGYKTPGVEVEEIAMGTPSIEGVEEEVGIDKGTQPSFMCDWFGVFCPQDSVLDLKAIIGCGDGTRPPEDDVCRAADHNEDGEVNGKDLVALDFSLQGPEGLFLPLDISGLDGKPGLDITDLQPLDDCLFGSGDCSDLGVGNPPPGTFGGIQFDALVGLRGNDFGVHMQNGNDVLLGTPIDDLIGGRGLQDLGDGPIPPDFFGPGNDRNDIFPFGSNGPGIDGPEPSVPAPSQPSASQLPQAVQDTIAKIIQDNPVGPCESLRISVARIRIGNTVKYRITVSRVRDESQCPPAFPQCPENTSYQSIGAPTPADCSAACQNGIGGCVVIETLSDGTNCILCGPPEEEPDDDDFDEPIEDEDEEEPDDDDFDDDPLSECDDEDFSSMTECKRDCDGECKYDGGACWTCTEKVSCPDIAHDSERACETVCAAGGSCSEMPDFPGCYYCLQVELEEEPQPGPVDDVCDSPTKERSACESSCNGGTCKKSYTRDDGEGCYRCQLECSGDTQTQSDCQSSCDGACAKSYTRDDGEKCYDCIPPVIVEDEGPSCPSGTAADKSSCESQCPSNGTCIGEDGCFSCLVVNCPDGTFKDECPSSCGNGCTVVGEQHGVSCYQCTQDCGTVCSENGYGPENTDHSDSILSELNGYSCVSGANISIQTATIGECNCVGEYSLSVDTTPPECTGTPCGDVQCGGSLSCVGGPGETITVNCNWGGWEKIQKHQFRPVVGN